MTLIERRHPAFDQLMRLWRARQCGDGPPPASALSPAELADLAPVTVTIAVDARGGELVIAESGKAVDALYGAPLAGATAARLSPERDDAELEARCAIATGRPLLIEDELHGTDWRRRIARLYLPLANDDGSPDGLLCGVVALA